MNNNADIALTVAGDLITFGLVVGVAVEITNRIRARREARRPENSAEIFSPATKAAGADVKARMTALGITPPEPPGAK